MMDPNEVSTNDEVLTTTSETTAEIVSQESSPTEAEPTPKPLTWSRRTFLRAAALGASVTSALLVDKDQSGRLHFGGIPALANDLSDYPCTAGDIDVLEGIVLNVPCDAADCSSTFCALVRFTVRNTTSTGRYCMSLHLPATTSNGTTIAAQDVLLKTSYVTETPGSCIPALTNGCPTLSGTSTADGKSGGQSFRDTVMYGVISGLPCTAQQICFGKAVPADFTGKCTAAGIAPCATISFATSPGQASCTGADQSPPRGQCRHRQICVRGFGVSINCADGDCKTTADTICTVPCGEDLKLLASASGSTIGFDASCAPSTCANPPTISLTAPDGTGTITRVDSTANGVATTCFTIQNPVQGTYTCTATDCHGCTRETSIEVIVSTLTIPVLAAGQPDCEGNTTFTATPCPPDDGVTYTFEQVNCATHDLIGTLSGTFNAGTCTLTAQLDQGETTCVRVRASNGDADCDVFSNVVTVSVPDPVEVNLAQTADIGCTGGLLSFEATASGGVEPYTFSFTGASGVVTGTGNKRTLSLRPLLLGDGGLDISCRTVIVRVTDSKGCQSEPKRMHVTQCITSTVTNGPCP